MLVDVYKNLHKNTWSIRDRQTGKVVEHSDVVHLVDAKFVVQPAGRQRVLRTRQKNIHAFVRGTLHCFLPNVQQGHPFVGLALANPKQVVYNPYESDKFRFKEIEIPVAYAKSVVLNKLGVWIDAE